MRHGGLASNPSASNAEAFAECGASHVLPQRQEASGAAGRGTDGHHALTCLVNGAKESAKASPGWLQVQHFPLQEVVRGVGFLKSETAYAVNVKTRRSRFIGIDIGRNYGPLEDYEIPCSLDIEGLHESRGWLRDWKFGITSSVWQLAIQAMAVSFWREEKPSYEPEVDAGFCFIDGDTGGAEYEQEEHTFYLTDLEERADQLVKAFDRVKEIRAALDINQTPATREGGWCRYCAAQPFCPSKWAMIRAASGELSSMSDLVGAMTLEKCGSAWKWLQEIERFTEKAKETLKERLEHEAEGFPLPSGKLLQLRRRRGWSYPQKEPTLALLRELGATDKQVASVMVVRPDAMVATEVKR